MASLLPSRFNKYAITTTTRLSADVWNASVGDLALRMEAVEEKATGYDTLVNAGIGVALDRINQALTPAVTQIQTIISQTNTYLLQLQGNSIAASLVTTDPTHRFTSDADIASVATIAGLTARVTALEARSASTSSKSFYLATK